MVNTIYKGDIAEISWGVETGLVVDGNGGSTGFAFAAGSTTNSSTITIGSTAVWQSTTLLLPDNSLVGCAVRFYGTNTLTSDDFPSTRRTFYITANDTTANTITVQPALASSATNAAAGERMVIDSMKCPTFDPNMTDAAQKVLTDQFFGLLNSLTIPEPVIDVRRQHIVGLGRDVNILTSGRETLSGGSMEMNAHQLRWLKYALGGHTAKSQGEFSHVSGSGTLTNHSLLNLKYATATYRAQEYGKSDADDVSAVAASTATGIGSNVEAGTNALIGAKSGGGSSTTITLDSSNYNATHENAHTAGIFKTLSSAGAVLYGSYGGASGTSLTSCAAIDTDAVTRAQSAGAVVYLLATMETAAAGDIRLEVGATIAGRFTALTDYVQIIDKDTHTIPGQDATAPTVFKNEIRRVIAVSGNYIYLEEPLTFAHTKGSVGIERITYLADEKDGSPHIDATTKELKFGVEHTIFGHTALPTFSIEQSFRQTDATPGVEQLLRLYSGCKISDATISADTEGELKVALNYEAARHYTDTASVFTPHRMFENTANNAANRKVSGLAIDGEKPYLFMNLTIEAFGRLVLRGTSINIQVNNTNTARWYIRGYEGQSADADQVQQGGTQFASDITEAQRNYTVSFQAIVEDDRLWEELRTRRHHKNTNDLVLRLNKPGSASTRQDATITIEDYTITKADHQIPDDKGAVIVDVELAVRHMKIVENSPYLVL